MKRGLIVILFGILLLQMIIKNVAGWGKEGHYIIAETAEKLLTHDTKIFLKKLLHGKSLVSFSLTPNVFRKSFAGQWSADCHFQAVKAFTYELDDSEHNCTLHLALMNYTKKAQEQGLSAFDVGETDEPTPFEMVIHLLADAFQPTHLYRSDIHELIFEKEYFFSSIQHPGHYTLHQFWQEDIVKELTKRKYKGHWHRASDSLLDIAPPISPLTPDDELFKLEMIPMALQVSHGRLDTMLETIKHDDEIPEQFVEEQLHLLESLMAEAGSMIAHFIEHLVRPLSKSRRKTTVIDHDEL